jgi:hypothetical protein
VTRIAAGAGLSGQVAVQGGIMDDNIDTTTLAETPNFLVWQAKEPDGESTFHLELGEVTVHFFTEEWEEFLELVRMLG